ncbi:PaeR7I family type II restriction endonuclease [Sorangium sp. So ce216]
MPAVPPSSVSGSSRRRHLWDSGLSPTSGDAAQAAPGRSLEGCTSYRWRFPVTYSSSSRQFRSAKVPDVTGLPSGYEQRVRAAIAHYWTTLSQQGAKQRAGNADRGGRAAVTGGKHMDGFCRLVNWLLIESGMPEANIYVRSRLELPGYFRPTKEWDMLVVHNERLVAAIEFKSQKGPSFGNNFNNRTEEALGNAVDIWTAFREGAFGRNQPPPWLGWVMLLESCPGSTRPISVAEPHFNVFPEFHDTSYAQRYELLLRKLILERLYEGAALIMSTETTGLTGDFIEPAEDLSFKRFLSSLMGRVQGYVASL